MNVWIHTEDDALQNTTSLDLVSDHQAVKRVEAAMNDDIEERVALALRKVQQDFKADIFDFAGEFHRAYPTLWRQNQNVGMRSSRTSRLLCNLTPECCVLDYPVSNLLPKEEKDKEEEYTK